MIRYIRSLFRKFPKQSRMNKLFILCVLYVIFRLIINLCKRTYPLESFTQGDKFVLYHWKNCGHCKQMMPAWESFKSEYKGPVIIETKEKDDAPDEIKKYNIQSFPAILVIDKDGNKTNEYKGDRTKEAFLKYLN